MTDSSVLASILILGSVLPSCTTSTSTWVQERPTNVLALLPGCATHKNQSSKNMQLKSFVKEWIIYSPSVWRGLVHGSQGSHTASAAKPRPLAEVSRGTIYISPHMKDVWGMIWRRLQSLKTLLMMVGCSRPWHTWRKSWTCMCPGRPELADMGGHDWSLFWVGSSGCMVGWYMPSDGDVPGKTCPSCLWNVSPAGNSSRMWTSYLTHWSTCCSCCRQIELPCAAPSPACQYGSTGRVPIPHLHIPGLVSPWCWRPCPWSHENSQINFGAGGSGTSGPCWS